MTKILLKTSILVVLSVVLGLGNCFADTCGDLEYLGFSSDITTEIKECLEDDHNENLCPKSSKTELGYVSEPQNDVESNHEQLFELGMTRGFTANAKSNSGLIKEQVDQFWTKMSPNQKSVKVSIETKQEIFKRIKNALQTSFYKIIALEILDLPEGNISNKVRAVVRVTRNLKTKNSYKEIQKNLGEIKAICHHAATINGHPYLSELTTFVAENPKNKYYYEKTILKH